MTPSSLPAHISLVMMKRKQAHVLPQVLNHLATSFLGFPHQLPPYIPSQHLSREKKSHLLADDRNSFGILSHLFFREGLPCKRRILSPLLSFSPKMARWHCCARYAAGRGRRGGRHLWRRRREKEKGKRCCWHRPCPTRRKPCLLLLSSPSFFRAGLQ